MDGVPRWDQLAESLLLVVIICQDLFCGLLLGQRTGLGRALSRYMLVMGVTFLGALLVPVWPDLFLSTPWYWLIRLAIVASAGIAIRAVVGSFGGLRPACGVIWGRWEHRVMGERTWLHPCAPRYLAAGLAAVVSLLWLASVLT